MPTGTLESTLKDTDSGSSLALPLQIGIPVAIAVILVVLLWIFRKNCCCKRSKDDETVAGNPHDFLYNDKTAIVPVAGNWDNDDDSDVTSLADYPVKPAYQVPSSITYPSYHTSTATPSLPPAPVSSYNATAAASQATSDRYANWSEFAVFAF